MLSTKKTKRAYFHLHAINYLGFAQILSKNINFTRPKKNYYLSVWDPYSQLTIFITLFWILRSFLTFILMTINIKFCATKLLYFWTKCSKFKIIIVQPSSNNHPWLGERRIIKKLVPLIVRKRSNHRVKKLSPYSFFDNFLIF